MNLNRKQCKLIAHRGFSGLAPENTIAAFQLAGKSDFYGIECDIQTTKDNQLMVFHDDTLDRMTGVEGFIKELTYEAIRNTDINAGVNIKDYPNLTIPVIDDYLKICAKYQVKPIVEIKRVNDHTQLEEIIKRIKELGLYEETTIISFHKEYLIYLRESYADLKIQYLVKEITPEVITFCKMYRFDIDALYKAITKNIIESCHQEGILVNVYTVDDFVVAQQLIDDGVDFLTTNRLT